MHTTSQVYRDILSGRYKVATALQIGSAGTVSTMTDSQLAASGHILREGGIFFAKSSVSTFGGSGPSVGYCVSRTLTIKIVEPEFDIPRRARVVPFAAIYNDDKQSEWVPKGVYYIDTRKRIAPDSKRPALEITAYDAMMLAEQIYKETTLGDDATDIEVVNEIASQMGVGVDPRTVALMNRGHHVPRMEDYTYREILGYTAAMYGGNFVMSDDGKLLLLPLKGVAR